MMTNLDMELADSENNNSMCSMNNRTRNKKKRRKAADIPVKKFSDLYTATGEVLGNGACAAVKTYKNNTTNKEYAVKVNSIVFFLLIYKCISTYSITILSSFEDE